MRKWHGRDGQAAGSHAEGMMHAVATLLAASVTVWPTLRAA